MKLEIKQSQGDSYVRVEKYSNGKCISITGNNWLGNNDWQSFKFKPSSSRTKYRIFVFTPNVKAVSKGSVTCSGTN